MVVAGRLVEVGLCRNRLLVVGVVVLLASQAHQLGFLGERAASSLPRGALLSVLDGLGELQVPHCEMSTRSAWNFYSSSQSGNRDGEVGEKGLLGDALILYGICELIKSVVDEKDVV